MALALNCVIRFFYKNVPTNKSLGVSCLVTLSATLLVSKFIPSLKLFSEERLKVHIPTVQNRFGQSHQTRGFLVKHDNSDVTLWSTACLLTHCGRININICSPAAA